MHSSSSIARSTAGFLYQALRQREDVDETTPPHLTSLAFSPCSTFLLAGSMRGSTLLWDWQADKLLQASRSHEGSVLDVVWVSRDAFATGGTDGIVNVLRLVPYPHTVGSPTSGDVVYDVQHVYKLKGHSAHVNCVAVSPDSSMLCSASDDKTACLWDVALVRPSTLFTPAYVFEAISG
jgi:WD40 repeat protein